MSDKYKGIYRGQTMRLQNWNYGSEGIYFITICTDDKTHFFGKIEKGKMILSETGEIAEKHWKEIPIRFPFIKLDEFVIMPNHMHGILIIDKGNDIRTGAINRAPTDIFAPTDSFASTDINALTDANTTFATNSTKDSKPIFKTNPINDNHFTNAANTKINFISTNDTQTPIISSTENSTEDSISEKSIGGFAGTKNPMIQKNISHAIRWYKGRCSFEMRKLQPRFNWQSLFYDHIIRNDVSMYNIQRYIRNNPEKWEENRFMKL